MKKLLLFLAFAPLSLVQPLVQAQTSTALNAPLQRDPKAIALFGQAVAAYKRLKTFSAVLQERNAAGGGEIYQLQWAPPDKAALLIRRIDAKRDGKFIADGKNVFRLLPDAPTFDRFPMRDASDADAVFTASPLLLFGIGPLLSGKNMAADEKIARGVTLGEIPSEAKEDLTAPVDVVQIQTVFPGESPDKLTDFIYAFDKTTHHLQAFWLRRPIEGQSKTASLLMQFEVLDTAPKADAFIWKAPVGVEEVPFAGLFAAPAATKTIQPTLEPAAIALLDKAAATYGGLKTLQMRIAGTGWGFDMRTKVSSSLFYERPNKIRIEGRGDGEFGLHVTDGKTLFY